MNKLAILYFVNKIRNSTSKDFKQLSKELDSMIEEEVIDSNEYSYLLGYLCGVLDTKINYNKGAKYDNERKN